MQSVDLSHNPDFLNLQRNARNLMLWPTEDQFDTMAARPQCGQRFIFKYPLYNGCHVCFTPGVARLAFDFDASGKFLGVTLVSVENQ